MNHAAEEHEEEPSGPGTGAEKQPDPKGEEGPMHELPRVPGPMHE
jgi:hypothetical protein